MRNDGLLCKDCQAFNPFTDDPEGKGLCVLCAPKVYDIHLEGFPTTYADSYCMQLIPIKKEVK